MKRIAAILAIAALLGLAAGGPAHADLKSYGASADAKALELSVLGQKLTIGGAHSAVDSTLKANAAGLGLATDLVKFATPTAQATGDGQSAGSKDEVCQAADPGLPVVSINLACGTAFSAIAQNLPVSVGGGRVGGIGIGIGGVLATTPLGDVATQLNTTVDGLIGQLEPVFTAVDQTGLQAGTLLETLLDEILGGNGNLVTVTLGKADTISESLADKVIARSTANGSTITVLDRPLLGPVLTITVGKAETFVSRATADGASEATYTAAIVSVDIADDIHALLPAVTPSIVEVGLGETQCFLPLPLTSCITVGGGNTSEPGAETTFAKAAGVRLDLLTGLPDGGVSLALAEAQSFAGAVPADLERTADIPAPPAPTLPRTGGQMPLAVTLGLAAVATGGLVLVRRTRAVTA